MCLGKTCDMNSIMYIENNDFIKNDNLPELC